MRDIPFLYNKLFILCMFTLRMVHKWTSTVPLLVNVGDYYVGHLKIEYTFKCKSRCVDTTDFFRCAAREPVAS